MRDSKYRLLRMIVLLLAASCEAPIDVGSGADAGVDASCAADECRDAAAPETCQDAGTPCETDAGTLCFDLTTDPSRCGDCSNSCASGLCTAGVCCEDSGGTVCPDADRGLECVDTQQSDTDCGQCGHSCGQGRCIDGECCATSCGGRCTPPSFREIVALGREEARLGYFEDLDGDGFDDAVFGQQLAEVVFVFWGGEEGGLDFPTVIDFGRVGPGVSFGDVDEDGFTDRVAAVQSQGPPVADQSRIARGLGERAFADTNIELPQAYNPNYTALLDVDGDGHLDLLSRLPGLACIGLRMGDGAAGFDDDRGCVVDYATLADDEAIRVADLDGDGRRELVELRGPPAAELWVHDFASFAVTGLPTSTTIATPGDIPARFYDIWDADGDGRDDVIAFDQDPEDFTWSIRAKSGSTVCELASNLSRQDVHSVVAWTAVGDINADGRMDVLGCSTCAYCLSNLYLYRGE